MGTLYNPSVEQGYRQTFESVFYTLAQQNRSRLASSPAVKYYTVEGNIHNISRANKTELLEVSGRNPDKQPIDLRVDNRIMRIRIFTQTFLMDKKDVKESIANPSSEIYRQLNSACNRSQDRLIVEGALADVEVGESDGAKTTRTASQDGVLTVDATSGLVYGIIRRIINNFINANVIDNDVMQNNLSLLITGKEHSDLMNEDKFINNDYTKFRRADKSVTDNVGGMITVAFAGSETGFATVDNPVLAEVGSTRYCLALAPQSIGYALRVKSFQYEENYPGKVASSGITVVLEQGVVRLEGAKVQQVNTTI